jgi:hypothetical protein
MKVNNNSNQAKRHAIRRGGLALVKPSDFNRLIPVTFCCYFRRKRVWRKNIRVSERTEIGE